MAWLIRRFDWIFIALATAVCLGYIFCTGHIWEDFFITFRHSENLCNGNGLVYETGRRIHGFTSPLGVLLPALCHWLTGMHSYLHALWAFRLLFGIPGYVIGGLLLVRLVRRTIPGQPLAPLVAGTLYLLEAKSVVFSTNGMETGLMLVFFLSALSLMFGDFTRRWAMLGVAWAGMMWTRPDACVFIAVLGIATLAFTDRASWRISVVAMLKAAAITTVLYLPWFAWAWWYYGSPVPHTIAAKGALLADKSAWDLLLMTLHKIPYCVSWVFGPVYPHFFSWPVMVYIYMIATGLMCFIYWLLPWARIDRIGRRASLMFFLLAFYFSYMILPYPWYFPPATALGIFILTRALFHFAGNRAKAVTTGWGLIALSAALTFGLVAYQLRLQQRIVEDGIRIPMGKWLKAHAAPEDRIYLECLGYVGYFSEGRMRDYPGLVTPEVVRLIREQKLNYYTIPRELRPEWVVLRLREHFAMGTMDPSFQEQYAVAEIFENNDELNRHEFIPGESYLLYDIFFIVFRRRDLVPPAVPATAPGTGDGGRGTPD
jgi:hypothetical protein